MRRKFLLALVAAASLALVAPTAVQGASANPANPAADEAAFVAAVNATRAKGGLPPLSVDPELTALARDWAQHMADGLCPAKSDGSPSLICHANPISAGVTEPWLKLGENVGTGPSVDPVMQAFINSPGHYANIMDPAFTRIGVGVVWNGNALYTTHRFMKVAGESASSTPSEPSGDAASSPAPTTSRVKRPATTAPAAPAPTTTAPPTTTTAPPPPPATPSRVAVVLLALHAMQL